MQLVITFTCELIEKDGRGWAPFQASAAVFPYRIVDEADTRNSRLILKEPSEIHFRSNVYILVWPNVEQGLFLKRNQVSDFKLV